MFYSFGTYEFDTDRRALYRAGVLVRLEPKVCDLLLYLIEHRARVVSREELYKHLWTETYVSDASLTYCISAARRAVGDEGRTQHTIKTMHGRGYAFVAPVSALPQRHTPPEASRDTAPGLHAPAPGRPSRTALVSASGRIASSPVPTAERRRLTILWCRVGFVSPAPLRLDLEDRYQLLLEVHTIYSRIIRRFEGYMAPPVQDGYVSYFGYPLAHEDAARRAVYAGLELIQEVNTLNQALQRQYGVTLTMSIGIHTVMVIMGAPDSGEPYTPLTQEDTPALAGKLAEMALANTVVLSPTTFRLVEGYVTSTPLGSHILDERTEALELYRVESAPLPRSRLEAASAHRLTAFVGREHELGLLGERWSQSQDGLGQVVVISGEAGIGKSRLVHAFRERLQGEVLYDLECRCSPYTQEHTLYPVLTLLAQRLGWQPQDSAQARLQRLEAALQASSVALGLAIPLLAPLFALRLPESYAPVPLSLEQRTEQTWSILLTWLLAHTAQRPVCLVVEDAHWIDPATLGFLTLLLDQIRTARILVLVTSRPAWTPPWTGRSHVTPIALSRLTPRQTEDMIIQVTGGKTLPPEVRQPVLEKTSGVPLFIEEMTKMVLESGLVKETERGYALLGPLPPLAIPTTLHDSLMARLDHQGSSKFVAQLGAMLGRDFSYEVLAAIAALDDATLQAHLAQLVDAEIIYQRGLPPLAQYTFKHVLIQEAAYQSLLRRTRQRYHRTIAEVFVTQFPDIAETQPERVAHHYTEAGQAALAATYWLRASQQASARSAHAEAMVYVQRGLTVIETLPETPERWQHALMLNLALGASLIATQGYAAPDVEQVYRRASTYCQRLDDATRLFPVLRGLWLCYLVRGQLDTAHALGPELLALAEQQQDASLITEAHRVLGTSSFFRGEHVAALAHMEHALAAYDAHQHGTLARSYGQDTGVLSQVYVAWSWWLRGYAERSQRVIASALALAQHLQHIFSLACALTFAAVLQQCRREVGEVNTYASQSVQLSRQYDFPLLRALGTVFQGWAGVQQGQGEAGVRQIQDGLRAYRATGAELARTYMLALLAESYLHLGQAEAGLATVEEALTLVEDHGERWWAAELYRLSGELLLLRPTPAHDEAAWMFQQAIHIACQQEAQALALRATVCLSRLWQRQGKGKSAHALLAKVYYGFREGLETRDLREARALLESLTSHPAWPCATPESFA